MGHAAIGGGQASDEASGAAPRPTPTVAKRQLQSKDTRAHGAGSVCLSGRLRHRRRQPLGRPGRHDSGVSQPASMSSAPASPRTVWTSPTRPAPTSSRSAGVAVDAASTRAAGSVLEPPETSGRPDAAGSPSSMQCTGEPSRRPALRRSTSRPARRPGTRRPPARTLVATALVGVVQPGPGVVVATVPLGCCQIAPFLKMKHAGAPTPRASPLRAPPRSAAAARRRRKRAPTRPRRRSRARSRPGGWLSLAAASPPTLSHQTQAHTL
jgi:hypothetical protein